MPSEPAARHYQGEAGRRYHQDKRSIPEAAIPWVARLRAEKFAAHIQETDVVFEYGVGSGWNLAALRCKRRLGFDLADFMAPALRAQGIEFIAATSEIADATIDVALCHHTLEHTLAPHEVLRELRRVLRPGGKLLLHVPFECESRYRLFNPQEPNHHLYSWNVQTLGNLVTESGFKVTEAKVGQFGYARFAAAWADRLCLGEKGFRCLRGLIHLVKPAHEARIVATKETEQTIATSPNTSHVFRRPKT